MKALSANEKQKKFFLDIFPPPDYLTAPVLCLDLSDKSLKYMEMRSKNGVISVRRFGLYVVEEGPIEKGGNKKKEKLISFFKINQRKIENRTYHGLSSRGRSFLTG